MAKPVRTGEFCPNETCPDFGILQRDRAKPNIKKYGKSRQGRPRFFCKTCGRSFVETAGTIFYHHKVEEAAILEALALMAEGLRMRSLVRVKGYSNDSISGWLSKALQHVDAVEEMLKREFSLGRRQLDTLWNYAKYRGKEEIGGEAEVGNRGRK